MYAPALSRVDPLPHQVAIHLVAIIPVVAVWIIRPIKSETNAAAAKSSAVESADVKSPSTPVTATRGRPRWQRKAGRRDNEQGDNCFMRHDFSPLQVDLELPI
jgi:hypothetical protein